MREIRFRAYTDFGMLNRVYPFSNSEFGIDSEQFYKKAKKPSEREDEDWEDLQCEFNFSDNCDGWVSGSGKIMQFTGLKDKNGVEIYEGDVLNYGKYTGSVSHRGKDCIHVVEFNSENASFDTYAVLEPPKSLHQIDNYDCVVIGNIYEHSYLLKNGE